MRGRIAEQDQDLLRAILLFSASGLDAVVKRLVKDTYHLILQKDEKEYLESGGQIGGGVYTQFESFVESKIKKKELFDKENQRDLINVNSKFLAQILSTSNTHEYLVRSMKEDLTSSSLQSFEQLAKVAGALEIASRELIRNKQELEEAFRVRNCIVHEMDIDLSQATRQRRNRNQATMIKYSNTIIKTAKLFIQSIETKL